MHFPLDLHIGSFTLSSHLVFELLAYSLGFRYFLYLRKRTEDSISDANRLWIFIGAAAGGLIGSRVAGVLENPAFMFSAAGWSEKILYIFSNKTIAGGLLGGLLGVELTKKIIGVRSSSGDLMTYPLLLGIIIGRIGCFCAGLEDGTYGVATSLPWAIDFGDGVMRHPTQLYEIAWCLLLWIALVQFEKKRRLSNGARFRLFMVGYFLFRFGVEFLKPVTPTVQLGGIALGTIQVVALLALAYYWRTLLLPHTVLEPKQ